MVVYVLSLQARVIKHSLAKSIESNSKYILKSIRNTDTLFFKVHNNAFVLFIFYLYLNQLGCKGHSLQILHI